MGILPIIIKFPLARVDLNAVKRDRVLVSESHTWVPLSDIGESSITYTNFRPIPLLSNLRRRNARFNEFNDLEYFIELCSRGTDTRLVCSSVANWVSRRKRANTFPSFRVMQRYQRDLKANSIGPT